MSVDPTKPIADVNWTTEPVEQASAAVPVPKGAPSDISVINIEGHRETTRSTLAKWLMGLLTLVVVGVLAAGGLQMTGVVSATPLSISDLATAVLTPVATLAGTALGFYFGAQTAGSSAKAEERRG